MLGWTLQFVPLDAGVCTPGRKGLYPWTLGFVPLDAGVCTLGDYFGPGFLLFSPFFLMVNLKIKVHISFRTKKPII